MDKLEKKIPLILTISLYFLFFEYALSATMIGPLVPIFIKQYHINLSDSGLITVLMGIGGILSVILGGIISDLIKKSVLIRLATFGYSVFVITIFFIQSFVFLLIIYFFIGASTKLLDAMVNAYLSDIHVKKRGFYMNLLHASFALGAFAGPIFTAILLNAGFKWNYVYLVLGVFCIIISFFYSISQSIVKNETKPVESQDKKNFRKLFSSKFLLILCAMALLYTGISAVFATWMPTFMQKELNTDPMLSSLPVSIYWLGILIGRLTNSALPSRFSIRMRLVLGGLFASVFLGSAIIINLPIYYIAALFFVGFFLSSIIPYSVALGCSWYPKNTGAVSSLIFFNATLGTLILPWIFGFIGQVSNLFTSIAIAVVIPVMIMILPLILPIKQSHKYDLS